MSITVRKHIAGLAAVTLALTASACGTTRTAASPATQGGVASPASQGSIASSPSQSGSTSAGKKVIAFLMPCSTCADRFESKDKPYFIQAVHDLDPSIQVIANNAQGSGDTQLQQAESALTNGASVIVMSPMTAQSGATTVAKADAVGASVVAYDGMVAGGAKPAYYVSFDNESVGKLQGQYLVDHLKQGAKVALINGAPDSAPGQAFKKGAHAALDPMFSAGKFTKAYEADTPNFDGAAGQQEMEQALTKLQDKVDGVLVANDGLANSVITALTARKLAGQVLVTGQDATDAGLQRILEGTQSMTVYKSLHAEADAAAKIAVALVDKKPADAAAVATTTVNNGTADIPSLLLKPVVVDKSNIASTVLKDGFTTKAKICIGAATTSTLCTGTS